MVVDLKTLRKHPGRNPDYEKLMEKRRAAQKHNREAKYFLAKVKVPRQPNKYVPHTGKKESGL